MSYLERQNGKNEKMSNKNQKKTKFEKSNKYKILDSMDSKRKRF